MALHFPINIRAGKSFLEEFVNCECGRWEDYGRPGDGVGGLTDGGDRSPCFTYNIAQRFKTKLHIKNLDELEEVWWALCTGTIQLFERDRLKASTNLAHRLWPHITQHPQWERISKFAYYPDGA